jgi:tetratricopeptide (TPR) repeat protein
MSDSLVCGTMTTIPLRSAPLRIILLLIVAGALGWLVWFILSAAIADSLMTFVQRNPNLAVEARLAGADSAVQYAARDPLLRWQRGGVYLNAANEDSLEERLTVAVDDLRAAAQLSPEDYRVWLTLGRALDRNGATAEARGALERAVQLAPNHFDPHWVLGNHLLRAGEREAAFAALRLALKNRPSALPLVLDYAWNFYQGDGRAVAQALELPPEMKPQLAAQLIVRGRVEDGLEIWREAAQANSFGAKQVIEALIIAKRFAAAHEIWQTAPAAERPTADADSLLANSSFEQRLPLNDAAPFLTWRVAPGGGVRVTLDRKEPRTGQQALRLSFDVQSNAPLVIATQTIIVQPATAYQLSFAARTEELQSLSTPLVDVFDAADQTRLAAASNQLPLGTQGWKDYELNFKTTAKTEAVTVRIQRPPCAEPPCPLNGRVWMDDFKLRPVRR